MKSFVLLVLLLTPVVLKAQSPYFNPCSLTNEGRVFLAFPDAERNAVLYWLLAGPRFKALSETKSLILTNVEVSEPLRIQVITNTIRLKEPNTAGKIIGGIIGVGLFGISCGLALSDFRNPNNGLYLGLGAGFGGAAFLIGVALDFGSKVGNIRLVSVENR